MDFYLDTEFIEGTQPKLFGKNKPTIDLISIGIISNKSNKEINDAFSEFNIDQRGILSNTSDVTYYAISKDFNLKFAWKDDWIRQNVLNPIYSDFLKMEMYYIYKARSIGCEYKIPYKVEFCYKTFKYLLNKYGKTNERIADEIKYFVRKNTINLTDKPNFYAYYADYDWVVFCWLFGRMIDLPNDFPMFCNDLKQHESDLLDKINIHNNIKNQPKQTDFKQHHLCPIQYKEHNALYDAYWNYKFDMFLRNIESHNI